MQVFVEHCAQAEKALRKSGRIAAMAALAPSVVLFVVTMAGGGFVTFLSPLNMLGILAVVGAGIYLADVRPALRQVSGRGSASGPYGPW